MGNYHVYILFNHSRTLYVGVTNDLLRRVSEHRLKVIKGFTARYNITMLAYYERFSQIAEAIRREKELKGWLRAKKIELIELENPHWEDLWEKIQRPRAVESVTLKAIEKETTHDVHG